MGDGKKLTAAEKKALKEKIRKLLKAGAKEGAQEGAQEGIDTAAGATAAGAASTAAGEAAGSALPASGLPPLGQGEIDKQIKKAEDAYKNRRKFGGGGMMPKYKKGGKLGKKKGLDFNKDGKITKADFILMAKAKMKRKK